MKSAALNPQRLDVAKFARAGANLAGEMPLQSLQRLSEGTCAPVDEVPGLVSWGATGSHRQVLGGAPKLRLRLQAQTTLWLNCQRCLQPMAVSLQIDRTFRFARSDEEAAELDETSEDEDFLALGRPLDLPSLVEDELIMALPIVPRHETCPEPLLAPEVSGAALSVTRHGAEGARDQDDAPQPADRPHPFAVLGTLKRQRST
jgi:uncharacterized protein